MLELVAMFPQFGPNSEYNFVCEECASKTFHLKISGIWQGLKCYNRYKGILKNKRYQTWHKDMLSN